MVDILLNLPTAPRQVSPYSSGELIMPTGTLQHHRVLCAKPEKTYRAFLDADAILKLLSMNSIMLMGVNAVAERTFAAIDCSSATIIQDFRPMP